jgi:hypothetical protein
MGTATGAAIDYLVAQLPAVLTAIDPTVVVIDAWATSGTESQSQVWVGKDAQMNAEGALGSRLFLEIGAGKVTESVDIPCFIYCRRPGPAQKPARDASLAIFDAVVLLVMSDMTLGGVILGGRIAQVHDLKLSQTSSSKDTAGGATAIAGVEFTLHFENHYKP